MLIKSISVEFHRETVPRNSNKKYIVEHYCKPLDTLIRFTERDCQEIVIQNT